MVYYRENACSGLIFNGKDRPKCQHEFPFTKACYGNILTPICCSEELCARFYPNTGTPLKEKEWRRNNGK